MIGSDYLIHSGGRRPEAKGFRQVYLDLILLLRARRIIEITRRNIGPDLTGWGRLCSPLKVFTGCSQASTMLSDCRCSSN